MRARPRRFSNIAAALLRTRAAPSRPAATALVPRTGFGTPSRSRPCLCFGQPCDVAAAPPSSGEPLPWSLSPQWPIPAGEPLATRSGANGSNLCDPSQPRRSTWPTWLPCQCHASEDWVNQSSPGQPLHFCRKYPQLLWIQPAVRCSSKLIRSRSCFFQLRP